MCGRPFVSTAIVCGAWAVNHDARRLINQALGQVAVGETGIPEPVLGIQVKLGVHRVQSPGGIVGDAHERSPER